MGKKLVRVFRDRRLTAAEVARYDEIRRKVQAEFPPTPAGSPAPGVLSQALRDAIRASGKSVDQIAQEVRVQPALLTRFLAGERDIRMATADKLVRALGLKLAVTS